MLQQMHHGGVRELPPSAPESAGTGTTVYEATFNVGASAAARGWWMEQGETVSTRRSAVCNVPPNVTSASRCRGSRCAVRAAADIREIMNASGGGSGSSRGAVLLARSFPVASGASRPPPVYF
jgi:hypothetical protein